MGRKEQLKELLAEDPQDEFLRYGLAMEYRKEGDADQALDLLGGLMGDDPPHVPSFLMAGQLLAELDRINESRDVLRRGIDAARAQENLHAAGEMSELLTSLGELGE